MKNLGLICVSIFILFSASAADNIDRKQDKLLLRSAHKISPAKTRHHLRHHKTELTSRANNQKHCICDDSPKLTIIYNGAVGLFSAVNESSNTAIIIDYSNDLVLLLNGKTGVTVLLDYNSNTAYQLDDIWKACDELFSEYFQGLTSLKPLQQTAKQKGGGTPIKNPSKPIKAEIAEDLTNLGTGSFQPQELVDFIGKTFITQLKGPLQPLYKGKGSFEVHRDLGTFLKLNSALGAFLANADDLRSIGTLDPGSIFSSSTGVGTFLNFIEQVGDHADLSKVFGKLLTDHTKSLRLLQNVEKSVSDDGVDGADSILLDVVLLLFGKGSIKDTLDSLLNYSPNGELSLSVLDGYRNQALNILENQLKKYNNQRSIGWLYNFARSKANGTLVIGNVNITDVINLLRSRNLGDVLRSASKILSGLFSPQNIRHLIQWVLNQPDVQRFVTNWIPALAGHVSIEGITSFVSELPIVSWLLPRLTDLWSNITKTWNETVHGDFKVILDEIASGSLGPVTTKLIRGLADDVSNFVSEILDHFGFHIGNPLNVLTGLFTGGGGLGETVAETGSLLVGGLSSDRKHSVHTSSQGKFSARGSKQRH